MNSLLVLLATIASLYGNPQVQASPVLLSELNTISQAANALVDEETAGQAQNNPSSTYNNPVYNLPVIQPILGDAPTEEATPVTTAWIEVNGQTGTVQLASGTYAGQESWGSTNADSCTVQGGQWVGNFGTSGEKNTGLFTHNTTTLSIDCTGDNDASATVTVITQ
jgi:hypothetical protein